jgi:5-hydroxyisourate hydrolase-like protein (transthyretin family)
MKDDLLEVMLLRYIPRSLLRGASSRRLNTRTGSGSSKLGLVLKEKTLRGLSARIRFNKTNMSGRYEQAWFREERNTEGVYPVASIYE